MITVARRMIKIFLVILLSGVGVYSVYYSLRYWLGLIDKEEMVCFDIMHGGGYKVHQKYDGFRILTTDYGCPSLIDIFVSTVEGEGYLTIFPKTRGIEKVKYSFWRKNKGFTIKKEVYEKIKATISISKEVDEFLAAHVAESHPEVQ